MGYIHLLINHWPILGSFIFAFVLAWGLVRHNDEVILLGLVGVLTVGVFGVATQLTGEAAEEAVEDLPGVSEKQIHAHEEAGEVAMFPLALSCLAAIGSLVLRHRRGATPRWAAAVTLVLLLIVFASMAYTARLGGKIRHTEFGNKPTASLP